ncbi:MAG: Uncharacterized protein G01um101433_997 [Parcubacteria group bacterium Gr01-1014_33]|nr:MAG: Uncharacterized protein G01um101433_997 [Parcubacteria group bacterium Gr01-1014_33]
MQFNEYLEKTNEIGFAERVIAPLVYVEGLPGAKPQEIIIFESGEQGMVTSLGEGFVEVLSFAQLPVRVGTRAARTDRVPELPVGEALLGHIIDSFGASLDPSRPVPLFSETRPIDTIAPGTGARSRIKRACETGVTMADLMIPLGKGQRELVMGDQKTGKSLFVMRVLLSQVLQGSVGVYAIMGKGKIAIRQIEETLARMGILDRVVIVASSADTGAGMIHNTPYSAMTIAEYFRDCGKDVCVVLDDLTTHAKMYREIALLGRRFPGRNSYPSDIFYAHARLLERAGNFLMPKTGEVSITCLPIVETVQGDVTGYIQTNSMSMTDGHIFFDHALFLEGRRPAIDPFLSVTRVGRQTQSPLRQEIGRALTHFLREMEDIHNFAHFGAELGQHIKDAIEKESRIIQFFDQTAYDKIPSNAQILLFAYAWGDTWKRKEKNEIQAEIKEILFLYESDAAFRGRTDDLVAASATMDMLLAAIKNFKPLPQNTA